MKGNYVGPGDLYNLKKLSDINYLRLHGIKVARKFYLFIFNSSEKLGFAVIASKKVGNAVKRNYEKRIIRVFIKKYFQNFPPLKCLIIRLPNKEGNFIEKEYDFKKNIEKLKKFIPHAG